MAGARDNTGSTRRRVVFGGIFVIAFVMTLRLLRTYTDLDIMLDAAREMVAGGVDIYRPRPPHPPYPYPHVVLLPLVAGLEVLGERATKLLYGLALAGATVVLVRDLGRAARPFGGLRPWQWALFAFLFVRTFSTSYRHGQLSMFVAVCLLRGVLLSVDRRSVAAGVWLGLATAMKLTPGLFGPVLLVTGRWRAALAMVATFVFAVVIVPWPFLGTAEHTRHLRDFASAMLLPRLGIATDNEFELGQGMSIRGTLPWILQEQAGGGHEQFCWVDLDDRTLRLVTAAWSAFVLFLCGIAFFRRRDGPDARWLERAAVVMLAMVLFSPLTRSYHLTGIALSGVLFCRHAWPSTGRVAYALIVVALALSMTLRQKWLLGRQLWWWFDHCGLPHLALVGMLAWFAFGPRPVAARNGSAPSP